MAPFAEDLDGPFVTALTETAAERGITIVAGMIRRSDDPRRPLNTLVVRGEANAEYDKIHLYDSFGHKESERLSAGEWKPVVIDVQGFKVGLMTCYDLRFPELARALVDAGAEVLVLPAAWVAGEHKRDHWRTLVHARAIENTVYVVAVGQPEPRYTGHSTVVSPMGDVLVELGCGEGNVATLLDRDQVVRARKVNPSLANRRG
ncbi:carbon-nitrogen hydrolase family protein [Nocardioides jishulii]|uniref:carbon-nitrogen hydrolase family protein n=1 Tax=Nocardioides jishulii TaxID=2575440 RepID=UPI001EF05BF8|nr:carbon-nitrogen hydrolase family protein [Nocardioides jishulii]